MKTRSWQSLSSLMGNLKSRIGISLSSTLHSVEQIDRTAQSGQECGAVKAAINTPHPLEFQCAYFSQKWLLVCCSSLLSFLCCLPTFLYLVLLRNIMMLWMFMQPKKMRRSM